MRISQAHWDELVDHARKDAPNECCGYGRLDDGRLVELHRAENIRQSPYGFELDSRSAYQAWKIEDEGDGVVLYHSHPRSAPEPSEQDRNILSFPGWTYVIVSLRNEEPEVRAWRIVDRRVSEEDLVVE